MARMRTFALAGSLCLVLGFAGALCSTLEEDYVGRPGWCPGAGCAGATIQDQHWRWHQNFSGTREFLDFHREFVGQSDDFRLYGADVAGPDPDPAAFAVVPVLGSLLEFQHTSITNGFNRPTLHQIDAAAHPEGGIQRFWRARPANLSMGNATFCGYTVAAFGTAIDGLFHGGGHMSIATHDFAGTNGDMGGTSTATRDGAFFQWHKYVDDVYSDWVVSQYQLCSRTGVPIFFSVRSTAVGTAPSTLTDRRGSNLYQGNTGAANNPATQYGAVPRIASDIYVADSNSSNLLYASGIKEWNTLNGWDVDAWSILNPVRNGWYFSVTMPSSGAPGTAVAGQAVKGGDVFESGGGGANALYRGESVLGLAAAASDELDAVEVDEQRRVQGTNDGSDPGIYNRPKQFFSLRSGSTFGLLTTSGLAVGPTDILQFGTKGELVRAVAGTVMGLVGGDDLDALAIVDADSSNTLTAADRIYYSLGAGSPSLGASSAADIFCHTVAGATCGAVSGRLEMTAAMLGLLAGDDLDALDVRATPSNTGACCKPDGTCADLDTDGCTAAGGTPGALGTVCSATQCPSAPGACCRRDGTCTQVSDEVCLEAGGTFRGPGVSCAEAACPPATPNDLCETAYEIPYDYANGYEPPADNTYAYSADPYANAAYPPPYSTDYDPPYSCYDHNVFFPPYGSGTIWYSYDVPPGPGPGRGLYLDTYRTAPTYPYGGGAGDTRLAIYYSPSGDCSTLTEVACGDNAPGTYRPDTYYASVRYDSPAPGRYYIQLSTVGDSNRGNIRLAVRDPASVVSNVPAVSFWGIIVLAVFLMTASWIMMRRKARAVSVGGTWDSNGRGRG